MIIRIDEKDKGEITGGFVFKERDYGYSYGCNFQILDDITGKVLDEIYDDNFKNRAKRRAKELGQSTQVINSDEKELLFDQN